MATYPFTIPSGTSFVVLNSGSNNLGTITSPFGTVYANVLSGLSLYQNGIQVQNDIGIDRFTMYLPNTSTSITNMGLNVSSFGTVSHPSQTEALPYAINFATAASSGSSAGMNEGNSIWYRGSTSGANGFNFFTRVIVPDTLAAYQSGVVIFVGMTNSNGPTPVSGVNQTMHAAGFQFAFGVSGVNNTNWTFFSKDLVTPFSGVTNIPFVNSHVYDMYVQCPPQSATINWRIDDRTAKISAIGSNSNNLPGASTALAGYAGIQSYSSSLLNLRVVKMKVNSASY